MSDTFATVEMYLTEKVPTGGLYSKSDPDCVLSPGDHCWCHWPGNTTLIKPLQQFGDQVPLDEIDGYTHSSNELQ